MDHAGHLVGPALAGEAALGVALGRDACCSNAPIFINCYQRVDTYITHDIMFFKHEKTKNISLISKKSILLGVSGYFEAKNFGGSGYFKMKNFGEVIILTSIAKTIYIKAMI